MIHQVLILLIAAITMACSQSEAKSGLNQSCQNKLSGTWKFGRAPVGCVIASHLSQPLESKYKPLTFNETQSLKSEEVRFTNQMYDFLVDYSAAYLKRREPGASVADVNGWTKLVLSTVHQESYWTQYRLGKDSLFRIFRGDGGHGYGLMQIDDRWHKEFIRSNAAFDINPNLLYGLDMLYGMRVKVLKKPCSGKKDIDSVNRSTYSAYNGGAGSKCRWLKNGKWAANDKGFWQKYRDQLWEKTMQASND
jgi:hypothetical protein